MQDFFSVKPTNSLQLDAAKAFFELHPVEKFRVEILPSLDFLKSYCGISSLDNITPVSFFERFFDDEDASLLKRDWWLRERVSQTKELCGLVCTKIVEVPYVKSLSALRGLQCQGRVAVEKELGNISCYNRVIAGYNVFRYQLPRSCTLDQIILGDEVHEILSVRFHSMDDLKLFERSYSCSTIPTNSKLFSFARKFGFLSVNWKTEKTLHSIQDRLNAMPESVSLFAAPLPCLNPIKHQKEPNNMPFSLSDSESDNE